MKKRCTKCNKTKMITKFSKHYRNLGFYQSWCKDCVAGNRRRWKAKNPKKVKAYDAKYRKTEHAKNYKRAYKQRPAYKLKQAEYRLKNKKSINQYFRERANNDPNFKMRTRLRTRIYIALKERRFRKLSDTATLVGCSFKALQKHLQSQFEPWMCWENYGDWHVDHIRPLCMFDLTKLKERKKAFHYTNLQPLSAKENMSKNGKYQKLG